MPAPSTDDDDAIYFSLLLKLRVAGRRARTHCDWEARLKKAKEQNTRVLALVLGNLLKEDFIVFNF